MAKIELGASVEDSITGFKGVVTGYVRYLTGCNQALVVPKVDDKGAFVEAQWFDEQRLTVLPGARVVLDNGSSPGPDRAAPKR